MNAIALNSSAFNVSRVVGPALAGTILAVAGPAIAFFLNAASFLAVLIGLLLIRPAEVTVPAGAALPARRPGLREGIRHIFGSEWPRALVTLVSFLTIFGASFIAILPVYARDVLHTGAGGYGALTSLFGVGAAAGALAIAAVGHRFRREATAVWAALGLGVGLVLLSLARGLGVALPLVMFTGLCMALSAIMSNTLLQTGAPDHLRGQVVGFYSFIVVGLAPFGSLQAGWISEHAGTPIAILIGGAVCATVGALTAWRMLRPRAAPPPLMAGVAAPPALDQEKARQA
jgi:MFS family permease